MQWDASVRMIVGLMNLKRTFRCRLPGESTQRELRDLTRYRTRLVNDRTREINRVQKVLEDANIKLGSVASQVLGVSGREMIEQMIAGEDDPGLLAQSARGVLRRKLADLERALTGQIRYTHRLMLKLLLEHIDELNAKIEQLNGEIARLLDQLGWTEIIERLDGIPGVNRQVAQVIVAELGVDMSRFLTTRHAASWARLSPGKNESAGRNRSAKIRPGNKYLKTMLVQAAHACGHGRDSYLASQFRRLSARRGRKRAEVAVAHSILVIVYHMLKRGTAYVELGGDYFDRRNEQQVQRALIRRTVRLVMESDSNRISPERSWLMPSHLVTGFGLAQFIDQSQHIVTILRTKIKPGETRRHKTTFWNNLLIL
jgi:transposase